MVALHYLKYQHDLSDENVVAALGGKSLLAALQRRALLSASRADRRLQHDALASAAGRAGAEQMLRATIETGIKMGVPFVRLQLKRINVDTTVQTKAIRFPTDAGSITAARAAGEDGAPAKA